MTLEGAARRSWDGRARGAVGLLSLVTTPLSWGWRAATAVRNARWDRWPPEPVNGLRGVSVGNLAVGGTGKTPVSGWIVARLRERGTRCAVLLSGYGEDEVALHRRWHPDVRVLAGRDRRALMEAARQGGAEVAVMDDAFQHRRAPRDLDVVLLAAEHPLPGRLLPRGRFREGPAALARADVVMVTRRTAELEVARRVADAATTHAPRSVVAGVALVPGRWLDLRGRDASSPSGDVLAVAAVEAPAAFVDTVRSALPGTDVRLRGFPDHHEYTAADVRGIVEGAGTRTIVTTEKDAVKLVCFRALPPSIRVLALGLRWDWGEDAVLSRLDGLARGGA